MAGRKNTSKMDENPEKKSPIRRVVKKADPKSITKPKVLSAKKECPGSERILTAEGWKRKMLKERAESKK